MQDGLIVEIGCRVGGPDEMDGGLPRLPSHVRSRNKKLTLLVQQIRFDAASFSRWMMIG
jgi:hypothetical protein